MREAGAVRDRAEAGAAQSGIAARLSAYRSYPGTPDLLLDAAGTPRPAWTRLLERLDAVPAAEIELRFASADRHIRDTGISYRIYGEPGELAWPLGSLPLVMDRVEWDGIAAGIAQRAELMERILADLYGEARLVRDGLLPAPLVAGSPELLRPLLGVAPAGGHRLHLYAADLGLGPDGGWRVLADRTQAPSGAGYALNSRLVLARAFPDVYAGMNVERLAPFFQAFRAGLAAAAERIDPRICILSSGPYSQTYVEQAYLARYLGFLLVEGDDLMVQDGRLHVRTVAGLKRADALWRRVDSSYVDPLALDGASRLGVPGLVDALRAGTLVVGNMPGSGLVEAPGLAAFLPALCRQLLGEELRLPGLRTTWCGDPEARRPVPDPEEGWSILPAYAPPSGTDRRASPRDGLAQALADRPGDYVVQETIRHGTAPVWADGRLAPRPFVMRAFAARTPEGWTVMPGAFCRMARRAGADPIAMSAGVESADLWVLSDRPVAATTLLPRSDEVRIRRVAGQLPSRAADNLFWLGRYLERAEGVIRLVRCLLNANETQDPSERGTSRRLAELLRGWTGIDPDRAASDLARTALLDPEARATAARHVRAARGAASQVRERLSAETWQALARLGAALHAGAAPTRADLLGACEAALGTLAALAGLAGENMNRAAGWRFLDMGRRVERAINTCAFARTFAGPGATADDLDALLELIDSQITYGARYILGVSLLPVRDMALLDRYNPRSVAFQLAAVEEHLAALPTLREDGIPEPPHRLAIGLSAGIATTDPREFDEPAVTAFEDELEDLADAICTRYFPGGRDAVRPETLTGLA